MSSPESSVRKRSANTDGEGVGGIEFTIEVVQETADRVDVLEPSHVDGVVCHFLHAALNLNESGFDRPGDLRTGSGFTRAACSGRFPRVFDLASILESRPPRAGSTKVIGIDGHGGAGKSTLADHLGGWLGAEIVHTDDFASWDNPKNWWPLLMERIFEPLQSGHRSLSYRRSQWWPGHEPEPVVDQPVTAVLILEGVGSLRREFRQFLSAALFVDVPREICIERGLTRVMLRWGPERTFWSGGTATSTTNCSTSHAMILSGSQISSSTAPCPSRGS